MKRNLGRFSNKEREVLLELTGALETEMNLFWEHDKVKAIIADAHRRFDEMTRPLLKCDTISNNSKVKLETLLDYYDDTKNDAKNFTKDIQNNVNERAWGGLIVVMQFASFEEVVDSVNYLYGYFRVDDNGINYITYLAYEFVIALYQHVCEVCNIKFMQV